MFTMTEARDMTELDRGEEVTARVSLNARPASEQYIAHIDQWVDLRRLQNRPNCSTDHPIYL